MGNFEQAHAFVAKWEGGFVMDPDDPGGATNFGVSFRFLEGKPLDICDINKDGKLTWHDVAAMTKEQSVAIFRRYFWDKLRLDEFGLPLALALYDSAVNCGSGRATKWLQEQLPGLAVDGALGPVTVAAVTRAVAKQSEEVCSFLVGGVFERRERHYYGLAQRRLRMAKYLPGWLNRLGDLRHVVVELRRKEQPEPQKMKPLLVMRGLSEVLEEVCSAGALPGHLEGRASALMRRADDYVTLAGEGL